MPRAEARERALRRELLLVRAATERLTLTIELQQLGSRAGQGLPGLLFTGARRAQRSGLLQLAASALRIARAQPWLVPAVAGGIARVARSRTLRYAALAALAAGAYWWYRHRVHEAAGNTEEESVTTAPDAGK
ncbi:MAG TPA: hypothetical protein PLE54_06855 [Burkholderiaceae bacterium]|nr:hypothetical protein [Burkholderiaceae bacterium]